MAELRDPRTWFDVLQWRTHGLPVDLRVMSESRSVQAKQLSGL